ncbi:MAG: hypothetical protein ACKV2T_35925 [Kofleriaceae bacterium]
MKLPCVVIAAALLGVTACKGKDAATFEIRRDVKSDTKKATGTPGEQVGMLSDAKPSLSIIGLSGPFADGMKAAIEKSAVAKKGAVTVAVTLSPASPGRSGSASATVDATALFAHPPELSKLHGTFEVKLSFSNVSPEQLGAEVGDVITDWIEGEKLPKNLGVSSGPAAKVTSIVTGPPNCTLHEDASVRCWDLNEQEAIPVPAASGTIAIDAANNFGACGVRKDGKAWCLDAWDNVSKREVREVCGVTGAIDVSVGQSTACALLGDGKVRCWPREATAYAPCNSPVGAVEVAGLADATTIETGPFDGCSIRKDGSVACWEHCAKGCNSGVVGRVDVRVAPKATAVKGLANAKQVVIAFQPCAWIGDDKIACAADGSMKASEQTVPEPIKALVRERIGVCAHGASGALWCGRGADKLVKNEVATDLVHVGGGAAGMCGVNSKNEVTCWVGMSGDDPVHSVALQ